MRLDFTHLPVNSWACVDLDNYDGAEDSHPRDKIVGYGKSKLDAYLDWVDQWASYDPDGPASDLHLEILEGLIREAAAG